MSTTVKLPTVSAVKRMSLMKLQATAKELKVSFSMGMEKKVLLAKVIKALDLAQKAPAKKETAKKEQKSTMKVVGKTETSTGEPLKVKDLEIGSEFTYLNKTAVYVLVAKGETTATIKEQGKDKEWELKVLGYKVANVVKAKDVKTA